MNDEDYPLDEERAAAATEEKRNDAPESNTRKYWRARLTGFATDSIARYDAGRVVDIEGWLDDWMKTYELSFAEVADSKPEYRLAVVDSEPPANPCSQVLRDAYTHYNYRRIVKMEDR